MLYLCLMIASISPSFAKPTERKPIVPQILIPAISISSPIWEGTSPSILDQNVVGILPGFNRIGLPGHTILAAHNYRFLFGKLDRLTIDDEIIILGDQREVYLVKEKHLIDEDDLSYFRETKEKKVTLITCVSNPHQRLLVVAYLK